MRIALAQVNPTVGALEANAALVIETMRAVDAAYGGEMSGHHYFREFSYCDSGMIPFLQVVEAISEDGLLRSAPRVLLPLADEDEVVHAQAARDLGEAGLAHDEALDSREFSFGLIRQCRVDVFGHDEPEHRISKELEALIVLTVLPRLVGKGAVRECLVQELQPAEANLGVLLEELELLLPFRVQGDETVSPFRCEQVLAISSPGTGCIPGCHARFRIRWPFHRGC